MPPRRGDASDEIRRGDIVVPEGVHKAGCLSLGKSLLNRSHLVSAAAKAESPATDGEEMLPLRGDATDEILRGDFIILVGVIGA